MEVKEELKRNDAWTWILLQGTLLGQLAHLNGACGLDGTHVNCLILTVALWSCWRVSLFAGKTHSNIQE